MPMSNEAFSEQSTIVALVTPSNVSVLGTCIPSSSDYILSKDILSSCNAVLISGEDRVISWPRPDANVAELFRGPEHVVRIVLHNAHPMRTYHLCLSGRDVGTFKPTDDKMMFDFTKSSNPFVSAANASCFLLDRIDGVTIRSEKESINGVPSCYTGLVEYVCKDGHSEYEKVNPKQTVPLLMNHEVVLIELSGWSRFKLDSTATISFLLNGHELGSIPVAGCTKVRMILRDPEHKLNGAASFLNPKYGIGINMSRVDSFTMRFSENDWPPCEISVKYISTNRLFDPQPMDLLLNEIPRALKLSDMFKVGN